MSTVLDVVQFTLVNEGEDPIWYPLTVPIPSSSILPSALVIIPLGTVHQQYQEVDWVEVGHDVRKSCNKMQVLEGITSPTK